MVEAFAGTAIKAAPVTKAIANPILVVNMLITLVFMAPTKKCQPLDAGSVDGRIEVLPNGLPSLRQTHGGNVQKFCKLNLVAPRTPSAALFYSTLFAGGSSAVSEKSPGKFVQNASCQLTRNWFVLPNEGLNVPPLPANFASAGDARIYEAGAVLAFIAIHSVVSVTARE